MPETFPKSHLAQLNLKYLQVKHKLIWSSKAESTITITTLNPPLLPKGKAMLQKRRRNQEAKRAQIKLKKQPLFLMVFISFS